MNNMIFEDYAHEGMGIDPNSVIKIAESVVGVVGKLIGGGKAKREGLIAQDLELKNAIARLQREIPKLMRSKQDLIREIQKFPGGRNAILRSGLSGVGLGKSRLKKARESVGKHSAKLRELEKEARELVDDVKGLNQLLVELKVQERQKQERQTASSRQQILEQQERQASLQAEAENTDILLGGVGFVVALIIGGLVIHNRSNQSIEEVINVN